jgi:hypothetical protein
MFDPGGGAWGWAIVVGTVLLGLAFAYGMIMAPRRRSTPDGTPPNESPRRRWTVIGAGVLFGLGLLYICWRLLRATPGVAG